MSNTKTTFVRGILIVISVLLIGIGAVNGGYTDVLNKAIYICHECMGIE